MMATRRPRHRPFRLPAMVVALSVWGAFPAPAQDFVLRPPVDSFRDVSPDHWAYPAIEWLRTEGMLEGWGQKFHGKRSFTRFEMAEILARYTQRLLETRPAQDDELRKLREVVTGMARMLATHQALLENPGSQEAWRKRLSTVPPPGSGNASPGPAAPAPASRAGDGASRNRSAGRPGRRASAPADSSSPSPGEAQHRRLLAALDALESRPVPTDLAGDPGFESFEARAPISRDRVRMAWRALSSASPPGPGPGSRGTAGSRQGTEAPGPVPEAPTAAPDPVDSALRVSRILRSPGQPHPIAPPGPGSRAADRLETSLMGAMQDIESGRLDPERARVLGYLASLALEARRLSH